MKVAWLEWKYVLHTLQAKQLTCILKILHTQTLGSWCKMHEVTQYWHMKYAQFYAYFRPWTVLVCSRVQLHVQNKLKFGRYHDTGLLMISCI